MIYRKHVFVCVSGKTCADQRGQAVFDTLRKEIKDKNLNQSIRINRAGCLDQCGHGPMVVVYPQATWYAKVQPSDCQELIQSDFLADTILSRLLYEGPGKTAAPVCDAQIDPALK